MTPKLRLAACVSFLAATISLAVIAGTAGAEDWPQFRGPNRDGKSSERNLLTQWPEGGPKLLWSAADLGKGFSHVAVANGVVYVTGLVETEGILRAFTLDGKPKWQASYGAEYGKDHPGARSIPTVHDGLVYVAGGLGTIACFDAGSGKPVWSLNHFEKYEAPQVKWGYAESVLIDGDKVILTPCGKKATMVALDRKTGKEIWASPALGHLSSFCSPMLVERGGKRMIVTITDSAVVAFSAADGKVLWQHPYKNFRQNHPVTPIYFDGMLYVTSGYGKGAICLALADDGASVKQVWEQPKQDPCHGQAVLVNGSFYASSHQTLAGKWTCVDAKTGKLLWQDAGVGKGGSVIFADGMLYCYSEDGIVGLVKPSAEKCQVVSTFKVPQGDGSQWAHPVVSSGKLFIRRGNALMCYDISADAAK
jgi:outer membrane protein assembly factor BamB